jgi:3D (Asp-Asp-Asp) domain-containing protein
MPCSVWRRTIALPTEEGHFGRRESLHLAGPADGRISVLRLQNAFDITQSVHEVAPPSSPPARGARRYVDCSAPDAMHTVYPRGERPQAALILVAGVLMLASSQAACTRGAPDTAAEAVRKASQIDHPQVGAQTFRATAYSVKGKTAAGNRAADGIVAADPRLLPLGSRIRVDDAGQYSGNYVVTDTGRKIHGRHIDLFIADHAEAKRFGKRIVRVAILERGGGSAASARDAAADAAATK